MEVGSDSLVKPHHLAATESAWTRMCEGAEVGGEGCRQSVLGELNWVKWVLLVFVCCEIVSLLLAGIIRFCVNPDGNYRCD